jgi:quercetin dioxygenase-like cupin family protein
LVVRGSARIRVDGAVHELHAGNIAVVEPGEVHVMLDGTDDYRHFVIQTPFVAGDKRIVQDADPTR